MGGVSIVLATYNGASYLNEQIDSIIANTYTDWMIDICDDGSTDRTLEIAQEYQKQYPDKIRIFKNLQQLGVTRNFLEGAKRATGDYIMFCDQDDVWLPEKIEKTLAFLKQREQAVGENKPVAVFTDAKMADGILRTFHESFFIYNALDTEKLDLAHLLMENKVIGCTTMFNRALVNKIKAFPKFARYHDWWIALIAVVFGDLSCMNEPTMLYRQHGGNVVGSQSFVSYVIDRIKGIPKQKTALLKTEKQAWEFYEIYKELILEEQGQILRDFASIHNENWFERRDRLFRHGYWKSGVLRNIGVFLLI